MNPILSEKVGVTGGEEKEAVRYVTEFVNERETDLYKKEVFRGLEYKNEINRSEGLSPEGTE